MNTEQTTTQKPERRRARLPLAMKTAIMIIVIAVIFTTSLITVSYIFYKNKVFEYYKNSTVNLAKTAAILVDGERLIEYLDTAQTDDYYHELQRQLTAIQQENGCEYLYIEYADMENMIVTYIMAAGKDDSFLGTNDPVLPEFKGKDISELMLAPYISETDDYGWLCSASAPIYDSQGHYAGDVGVDVSMNMIQKHMHRLLASSIFLSAAIAIIMVVLSVLLMKLRIVSPIERLSNATAYYDSDLILKNTETVLSSLKIRTGDEIEDLTHSVQKMERAIRQYVTDLTAVTAANEHISAELNIAANIQMAMLPRVFPAFPDRTDFDLYATMHPAKEVGGDFYDYFLLDYDHLAFIAADVSGKGVPAALFMVIAKTLIRTQAQFGLPPEKVFSKVNMQLCANNDAEMFVTAWMGILELSTGKVIYANAGHTRPVLVHTDGTCELIQSRPGFVLAGMEMMQFKQGELQLAPGETLFLYTDGVTEATNAEKELYGEQRLLDAMQECTAAVPADMIAKIKTSIDGFVKEAPQFDDITMMAVKYNGDATDTYTETKGFIATRSELPHVLEWLDALLERFGCSPKVQTQLDIAAEEIFVNIASYAYPQGTSSADITFHYISAGDKLILTFADKGIPYDPLKQKTPDVTLSLDERKPGGLGVFMVKKTMDSVKYRYDNGQNILTIEKTLN